MGKDFMTMFNHLGRASILFQEGIYHFGGTMLADGFQSPFPAPWQALTRQQKDVLMDTVSWNPREMLNFPGFRRSDAARSRLFSHFEPKPFDEVFGHNPSVGELAHGGHLSRLVSPHFMYKSGTEVLAVEIDWAEYSNEELAAQFLTWLSENRPSEFPSPKSKGKRISAIFSSLEWLGITRLLHRAPKVQIEKAMPEVRIRFGASRDWYRDRRKANGCLRELFPFLPEGENLRCWPTSAKCAT
ncbi:MAG: hypothetical protein KDK97_18120 [Verrucomicrobiales bacterium]|nr:hypothetical protein [Verrucomicrobiales bacterium]